MKGDFIMDYSKVYQTILNFSENTSSGDVGFPTATGDFIWVILILLAGIFVFSAYLLVKEWQFEGRSLPINKKRSITLFFVITIVLLITSCIFIITDSAKANVTANEVVDVDVSNNIIGTYENNNINIQKININNNSSSEKVYIKGVSIKSLSNTKQAKWTISAKEINLYDNVADMPTQECNYEISPNTNVQLTCATDMSIDEAIKLQSKQVIDIEFTISNPDYVSITGSVKSLKNIGSDGKTYKLQGDIPVHLNNESTNNSNLQKTDSCGNYKFVEKKGSTISLDVSSAGVVPYNKLYKNLQSNVVDDITLTGLDFYSIPELKEAANKLKDLNIQGTDVLVNSDIYKEFYRYMGSTTIEETQWYSNSEGRQIDKNNIDYRLCNQDYRNNFKMPEGYPDNPICKFVFLRVLDICHDELANNPNVKSGLTLATTHALPSLVTCCTDGETCLNPNWGLCEARKLLNEDNVTENGRAYIWPLLCSAIKDNINVVSKYYQADHSDISNIEKSQDKLFLLSYSELWAKNIASSTFYPFNEVPYYDNGKKEKLENTEGYLYKWCELHEIDGSSVETETGNDILKSLGRTNDGSWDMFPEGQDGYLRSPMFAIHESLYNSMVTYDGSNGNICGAMNGTLFLSVAPAFCF